MELLEKLTSFSYEQKSSSAYANVPFGHLIEVWADFALKELQEEIPYLSDLFSLPAQEKLKESLIRKISEKCAPTLAALMHLEKHKGNLQGETPHERYLFFVENRFSKLETLSYFPFLLETLSHCIFFWKDQAKEFASRLHADFNALQFLFSSPKSLGKVVDLSAPLSDSHNGHRTTYQLTFEKGFSIGYKPKPLALDVSLAHLLEKLEEWGLNPALKLYRVYNREGYGWCEWVPTLPCKSKEEVRRYFQRFGMWICLVYLLGGTDCHSENLIASGEFPVLVDLESLFHPITKEVLSSAWDHSVFRTGFFPTYNQSIEEKFDFSPLTAEEEQEISVPTARWKEVNTDQMEFAFDKVKATIPIPRPRRRGKLANAIDFLDDLLIGFEKMYTIFSQNREKITPLVQELASHPVRCILRPTELYGQVLQRLTDPKLMHSQEEREYALEVLTRHCPFKEFSNLEQILQTEKKDLRQGDIPFFLSLPQSTDLYDGKQTCIARDCFEQSALEKTVERLSSLSEGEKQRQMEYMRQSLLPFLKEKRERKKGKVYRSVAKRGRLATSEQLSEGAFSIAQKIVELADPLTDGSLSWLSLEIEPKQLRHVFHPLSIHLYSGHFGIALFFAALEEKTFSDHAKKIVERQIENMKEDFDGFVLSNELGGMVGLGSCIYSLGLIGTLLKEENFLGEASLLASKITKKRIEQDGSFDLLHGSAGLILALLSLHAKTKEPFLLETAKEAGFHLVNKAQEIEGGKAWAVKSTGNLPGLSHGTAGIAYALLKLCHQTGESSFYETARQALVYEQAHSERERSQWCHGDAGVALAQAQIESLYPELKATYSIESILNRFVSRMDHLCCGNFGRLSILWTLSAQNEGLKKVTLREASRLLQKFQKTGSFSLFPPPIAEIQNPSFMRGLAGIGYTLLRMTPRGEQLPEVLVLE